MHKLMFHCDSPYAYGYFAFVCVFVEGGIDMRAESAKYFRYMGLFIGRNVSLLSQNSILVFN